MSVRRQKNGKPAISNSCDLKSVLENLTVEIKLRFRDGLVWTVDLTVEIKLRFRDGLVWTVGLNVEIKLRFRDGLVWTVGLNVEIKLRFRDGLVWTVGLTVEIKLRFRDGLVWTVGLNVEIKLRFRDGLEWTVGLTVEIKLCFRISPAQCGRCLIPLSIFHGRSPVQQILFQFRFNSTLQGEPFLNAHMPFRLLSAQKRDKIGSARRLIQFQAY